MLSSVMDEVGWPPQSATGDRFSLGMTDANHQKDDSLPSLVAVKKELHIDDGLTHTATACESAMSQDRCESFLEKYLDTTAEKYAPSSPATNSDSDATPSTRYASPQSPFTAPQSPFTTPQSPFTSAPSSSPFSSAISSFGSAPSSPLISGPV